MRPRSFTSSPGLQVGIETMAVASFALQILIVGAGMAGAAELPPSGAAPLLRSPRARAVVEATTSGVAAAWGGEGTGRAAAAAHELPRDYLAASSSGSARSACLAENAHCRLFEDQCCQPFHCAALSANFFVCQ